MLTNLLSNNFFDETGFHLILIGGFDNFYIKNDIKIIFLSKMTAMIKLYFECQKSQLTKKITFNEYLSRFHK